MQLAEFRARWAVRSDELRRLHAMVDGAKVIDAFLSDLSATLEEESDELISIRRAAELSGYSVEHLCRSVREGRIPNSGRSHKPLIRRCDLPRKPKSLLASADAKAYDAAADARSLMSRQGGRKDGASNP
jgi:hypothetical protein